jgi:hypothetical protein
MAFSYAPSEATSTTASTILTPRTNSVTLDSLSLQDDSSDSIPWPGNTYAILDKASGKAISVATSTNMAGQHNWAIFLSEQRIDNFDTNSLWLCVEAKGYFGFFNEETGKYLGYSSSKQRMLVLDEEFNSYQYFIPRRHFNGGYQLLTAANDSMEQVAFDASDSKFVRRQHAGICWKFVKVSGPK